MNANIFALGVSSVLAMTLVVIPLTARAAAAGINPPVSTGTDARHGKHWAYAFRGKVTMIDSKARTLTVGKLVLLVTADTRIIKDGHPVTLAEGAAGELVSGSYRKVAEGRLQAVSLRFSGRRLFP